MNKEKIKLLCMDLVMLVVLVLIDYYTKYLAVIKLKNQAAFNIIDGVLEFNYLENRGAAFGMLQNQKIFFVFIAVIFLSVIIFVLLRTRMTGKYRKLHDPADHDCRRRHW
ncbi:MAG: signal peptidase II [Suilimivivens sp.]